MRAVVTGGAGFLGSHLCDRLIAEGWDVLALDNLITGVDSNVGHLLKFPRFRVARADVSMYIDVPGPVDYAHITPSGSPSRRKRSFCWPQPANVTVIPRFRRSMKNIGAT